MELVIPVKNMDFDFNNGARNSPYQTAPSTPRAFGGDCYYSAPPSPTRLSDFYGELDDEFYDMKIDIGHHGSPSQGAFQGEVIHETTVSRKAYTGDEDVHHFAFDVSEEVEGDNSTSAEELFHGGMIKPLKSPSGLPKPGKAMHGRRMSMDAKELDPFTSDAQKSGRFASDRERGRERITTLSSSSRRSARSLSPLRVSQQSGDHQEEREIIQSHKEPSTIEKSSSSSSTSSASSKGQKKWRFKDLFLFRNASEGRASDKDLLKKYTATMRANERAAAGTIPRRKGPVSAHELLYTENRAAREELKKKTFLPYKAGVWGGMPFNPALANGFGFSHK